MYILWQLKAVPVVALLEVMGQEPGLLYEDCVYNQVSYRGRSNFHFQIRNTCYGWVWSPHLSDKIYPHKRKFLIWCGTWFQFVTFYSSYSR